VTTPSSVITLMALPLTLVEYSRVDFTLAEIQVSEIVSPASAAALGSSAVRL
jgi:hypothetical protein